MKCGVLAETNETQVHLGTREKTPMRGPQAQEWTQAVCEEIESFKRLGVKEEMAMERATSAPLPARLILVTKPNVHGGQKKKEG